MRQYKGAVFFVDMLGIGALTQKKVPLTDMDYKAWGISSASKKNEQVFCAKLLMKFRACLAEVKGRRRKVHVAQLSDCAFVWSNDVAAVVQSAQGLMWLLARAGLLCRGGISYGDIVEPDKVAKSMGHFVLGAAATNAVDLEKKGKGFRIFADQALVRKSEARRVYPVAFSHLKNPLDGSVVNEFQWYLQDDPASKNADVKTNVRDLLELISLLRYSPLFNWNASGLGMQQLDCSIESTSAAAVLIGQGIGYRFATQHMLNVLNDRTSSNQRRFLKMWLAELEDGFQAKKSNG